MKNIFIFSVLIIFIAIQFARPRHNISLEIPRNDFLVVTNASDDIITLMKSSCYDCHSNNTDYPWYGEIAPISWWISYQIDKGKHDLNFSEWETYSTKKKDHKIEELVAEVQEGEMPLKSYTWTHGGLTEEELKGLVAWAERNRVIYQYALKYKNGQLAR